MLWMSDVIGEAGKPPRKRRDRDSQAPEVTDRTGRKRGRSGVRDDDVHVEWKLCRGAFCCFVVLSVVLSSCLRCSWR
jgi:hypothetical protein